MANSVQNKNTNTRDSGNGNDIMQRNQESSVEFPTDLQHLSEADEKKWFRVEVLDNGLSILKVRTELLNLPDEVGEPGFLEKSSGSYSSSPSEKRWVMDRGEEEAIMSEFKKLELKGLLKPEPMLVVSLLLLFDRCGDKKLTLILLSS